ncbi:MAG TPA: exodeoxyribonuclease VII large subunit [Myxococcota bacterium]|nr:exodeoxyribonuclease VII large subunit [Myxococcota bacterium]
MRAPGEGGGSLLRDAGDAAQAPGRVLSVGQLVAALKALVETEVGRVWVVGEISNLRRAGSGHLYFTLKDDDAQLRACLFRADASRLPFELEDGLEVVVGAECGVYAARGELQLVVRHVEPRGRGALQLAFEQLRVRLEREGLFDPTRKRALPPHPRRIAVVTSASAAALRDVIQVSGRRLPSVPLLVVPTRVQGEGAELEIAAALDGVSAAAAALGVDVILLVRGGGSLEDLQAFNSEAVARAVARACVPVVCGVGHEVDVTIADLAADLRAPTPSAAAAAAVPDGEALADRVDALRDALARVAWRGQERRAERLARLRDALARSAPRRRLALQGARLDAACEALVRAFRARVEDLRHGLEGAAARLDTLSPLAVLARGYAIVWRTESGAIVRRAEEVAPGDVLRIRLASGELAAQAVARGAAGRVDAPEPRK